MLPVPDHSCKEGGAAVTYMENTYICLAAPLLLAILCLKKDWRRALLFLLSGMTSCLLSAYVSSYFTMVLKLDPVTASHEIVPVVEEIIKILPVLFELLVFESKKKHSVGGILLIAVGFATFENVCFMTSYGTGQLPDLLIRGFGTGAMHVVCGMMVAVGLFFLWDRVWLRAIGLFAVLCAAVTFHAIFNILVNYPGILSRVGSAVPLAMFFAGLILLRGKADLS